LRAHPHHNDRILPDPRLTAGGDGTSTTFSGVIGGSGGLIKTGSVA
jgi:hypothetical protein